MGCVGGGGSKTANDRIRAKLKKILARHAPPALPEGAAEKIAAILREAKARVNPNDEGFAQAGAGEASCLRGQAEPTEGLSTFQQLRCCMLIQNNPIVFS